MDKFVGREDAVESLSRVLTKRPVGRLVVASVSGPGGVGKSFLVDHVLAAVDVGAANYLKLASLGTDSPVSGISDLITRRLPQSCKQVDVDTVYMGRVRSCKEALDDIERNYAKRIASAARKEPLLGTLDVLRVMAHAGVTVSAVLEHTKDPKLKVMAKISKEIFKHVEKNPAVAEKAAQVIYAAAVESEVPVFSSSLTKRLRKNASVTLCEAFVADLTDMLVGWEKEKPLKKFFRLLPPKARGVDRLLLIIDDYESLPERAQSAFIHDLFPMLANAKFESTVIVIGRDSLTDAHTAWTDRIEKYVAADIRLLELSADEAAEYVRGRGISDAAVVQRIVDETRGFPFLLASEVEAENAGGRDALSLMKFVTRTTRWMTDEQRDWLVHLCFLDVVNEDTIGAMLPAEDPKAILDWFKREASIRARSGAAGWQVVPIVRSRVQSYVRLDSPRRHDELANRAKAAAEPEPPNTRVG